MLGLGHLISSWWLGWRRHTRVCKPFLGIIGFKISKLDYCLVNYIFVLDKRNTAWLRDTVRQTSLGKSAAGAAPDFPRDVCLTVSHITMQYSYYSSLVCEKLILNSENQYLLQFTAKRPHNWMKHENDVTFEFKCKFYKHLGSPNLAMIATFDEIVKIAS